MLTWVSNLFWHTYLRKPVNLTSKYPNGFVFFLKPMLKLVTWGHICLKTATQHFFITSNSIHCAEGWSSFSRRILRFDEKCLAKILCNGRQYQRSVDLKTKLLSRNFYQKTNKLICFSILLSIFLAWKYLKLEIEKQIRSFVFWETLQLNHFVSRPTDL